MTSPICRVSWLDRVIDEAWATAPPAPPVGAGNLGRAPELPLTRAGLAKALELAGWRVRWNPVARHVEAQRVGGVDWEEAAGLLRHRMMVDTSEAATMRRGAHLEPWRIASARLEDRLLAVVASHDVADFADVEGSQTYETVLTWATATASGRIPMQISDVVSAASPLDL